MAGMTPQKMQLIRSNISNYSEIDVLIETGTLEGNNAVQLCPLFRVVHTVEFSESLWRRAAELHRARNISFLLGDSAVVVPQLSRAYSDRPAIWYLDAHWFSLGAGKFPISRENPFPLWSEISVLAGRNQPDIIIVDDVHSFGREGEGWEKVSKENLDSALGERLFASRLWEDHYVAWMK